MPDKDEKFGGECFGMFSLFKDECGKCYNKDKCLIRKDNNLKKIKESLRNDNVVTE
jgi:hypothetical protein